jgi:hypothetical protein
LPLEATHNYATRKKKILRSRRGQVETKWKFRRKRFIQDIIIKNIFTTQSFGASLFITTRPQMCSKFRCFHFNWSQTRAFSLLFHMNEVWKRELLMMLINFIIRVTSYAFRVGKIRQLSLCICLLNWNLACWNTKICPQRKSFSLNLFGTFFAQKLQKKSDSSNPNDNYWDEQ